MLNTIWWCARGGSSFHRASSLIDKTDNWSSWWSMCSNLSVEVEGSEEVLNVADSENGSWEVSIMLVTFQLRLQVWGSIPGKGQSWGGHYTFCLGGCQKKNWSISRRKIMMWLLNHIQRYLICSQNHGKAQNGLNHFSSSRTWVSFSASLFLMTDFPFSKLSPSLLF